MTNLHYKNDNDLQRGDRVRIDPEGFTSRRFKVDAALDGQIGIVLRQVPFLDVAEVYFPVDGETSVKAGKSTMVEVSNLTLLERDEGRFTLPSIKKYAELDMLSSWMQCSVSSQESIDRYEELTDPESIEALCIDYHVLADENDLLKAELKSMAGLLLRVQETTAPIFGLGQISDECGEAVKVYSAKYGSANDK